MATQQFNDAYTAAYRKDCATLHLLSTLKTALQIEVSVATVRLADTIQELGMEFVDTGNTLVDRYNRRANWMRFVCPMCGSEYCQGNNSVVHIVVHGKP